jgi:hypothetical protein
LRIYPAVIAVISTSTTVAHYRLCLTAHVHSLERKNLASRDPIYPQAGRCYEIP